MGDPTDLTILVHALRLILGTVFAVSAFGKARAPRSFAASVRGYDLVPPALATAVAYVLIPWEIAIAVALLVGIASTAAALAALGTIAIFSIAVAINLSRHRVTPCGCFGVTELISGRTLARLGLLGFAAVALVGLALSGADVAADAGFLEAAYAAGIAGVLALSAYWLLRAPDLLWLAHQLRADDHVVAPTSPPEVS